MRFGEYLAVMLESRGLSAAGLNRALGAHKDAVQRAIRGDPPPVEALEQWPQALGLTAAERAEWEVLYYLEHTPPFIAQEYRRLRRLLFKDEPGERAKRA